MAIDDKDGGDGSLRSRATSLFGDSDDEQPAEAEEEDAYNWVDFRREFHDGGAFDRSEYLGFDPHRTAAVLRERASDAETLNTHWQAFADPETTPVRKGEYYWEHFKREYYYESDGSVPHDDAGEKIPFEESDHLGFEPDELAGRMSHGQNLAEELVDLVDERTVDVNEELDEDAFFSTVEGNTTVVNRYDLERAVPMEKKRHFEEVERYWVNKPYACVVLFHSKKENERKYYVIEPALNDIERELKGFLGNKLKTAIKYAEEGVGVEDGEADRAAVIEREAQDLLKRYDIYEDAIESGAGTGSTDWLKELVGMDTETDAIEPAEESSALAGIAARPEPAIIEEDPDTLTEYQVEKLLYLLKRDYIGYGKIDPIKHDINVEDVSCDGYNSRVFVYHTDYEQIISNVEHGESDLDDFVVKLAQRSGKGISKRQPQVDATLPDGSRAQLTLGREVSDHGTNYTIRQFKDVPFTPVDLINWNTFSLDEMAFLWLAIENNKSMIFAGGTASGKTTSLNAISLFIPSNAKIVSIEDTREVELPQRNWVASVTRPSFGEDQTGDIDEFDLLEAALRQRPDYIVMGEVRGEEGRDLFQVMSTGHTGYSTFHADTVGEVIKRFTTDPINVSKTLFTALDLVSIQTQTRVQGRKVRRNKTLTEINEYSPENDEINVRDVYQWQAESDEFLQMGSSSTLEEIKFDRGWDQDTLDEELFMRKVVLAYLIEQGLNTYTEVAATLQAFINDPKTIMTLIANDQLDHSLEDLREMESVQITVDPAKEEMVPRPDPPDELLSEATDVLENATPLFDRYKEQARTDIVSALADVESDDALAEDDDDVDFGRFVPKAGTDGVEGE
ncbi:type II secretion system protein E [Halorhabdus utahensis DSM 12940]|uniref:Type II secretion system protein E n=1 Tax=Halorhabdus utahensis (strain DSM 12940 / JCM 11049 / AX-2) TaxID=519442 RepID=C7NRR5_HALUD|nr:type II/IV secretion system ATPase subunit [Halorhabdus utahensis]ACV13020.1 type II secretion system protein E [Halorhabdus utahensis DSM 12940]